MIKLVVFKDGFAIRKRKLFKEDEYIDFLKPSYWWRQESEYFIRGDCKTLDETRARDLYRILTESPKVIN